MLPETAIKQTAIIFDLGGVLIDWNPQYLFGKMFNGAEKEMEYFLTVVCPPEWNDALDAGRPFAEAVEERSREFPQYEPYIRAFHERWEEMVQGEFTETVKILAALREKEYPLFALSNWSAETFPLVKNRFDFLSWFDDIIISGAVHLAKPDPAIFKVMLEKVNQPAEECLFIDDNERNVLAAQDLGIQTIHFFTPQGLERELAGRNILNGGS